MPFQKIKAEKLSTSVTRQIEGLILRGVLRPGERLPPERQLAEKLGVSRPSLRDALADLEARQLLNSKAGAGVFVAEVLGSAFSKPLIALFASHEAAMFDYLSFRRDLEGLAAQRAAKLATKTDLKIIDGIFTKLQTASANQDQQAEARYDAEFHLSIIEASHNIIMVHMMRSMFEMLKDGVFYNRQVMFSQKTTRASLLAQHGAINAALQDRDAKAAKAAVEAHLDFVAAALQDLQHSEKMEDIARQRLQNQS